MSSEATNLKDAIEPILRRLNVLIALQFDLQPDAGRTMKQRAERLAELGLGPAEIGSILGRKANYISALLGAKKGRPNE